MSMKSVNRVRRYDGRGLGSQPHIAVLGSSKVGNFVVTLPLLRLLRKKYPGSQIDFWGTEATRDFEMALCDKGNPINWRYSWDEPQQGGEVQGRLFSIAKAIKERESIAGKVDLAINCDGFNPLTQTLCSWIEPKWVAGASLNETGRSTLPWGDAPEQKFLADQDWNSRAFINRYSKIFDSNYIAELLCRMVHLKPTQDDLMDIDLPWCDPPFTTPKVLIHITTTRAAKIWPIQEWNHVLKWCEDRQIDVGLIGAPPKRQINEYNAGIGEEELIRKYPDTLIDLRGKTSLIQLAGACKEAKAVVSVDAGPMHIAAAVGTPTLAVVGNDKEGDGASPISLWLPRSNVLERTVSTKTCTRCCENRFKNDECIADEHVCMQGVSAQQVINWLDIKLK